MTTIESPGGSAAVFSAGEGPVAGHERVVFGHDRKCGLRAIIAVHDTTLGPALGEVVRQQVQEIFGTVAGILSTADERGITAGEAAAHVAEKRLRDATVEYASA